MLTSLMPMDAPPDFKSHWAIPMDRQLLLMRPMFHVSAVVPALQLLAQALVPHATINGSMKTETLSAVHLL